MKYLNESYTLKYGKLKAKGNKFYNIIYIDPLTSENFANNEELRKRILKFGGKWSDIYKIWFWWYNASNEQKIIKNIELALEGIPKDDILGIIDFVKKTINTDIQVTVSDSNNNLTERPITKDEKKEFEERLNEIEEKLFSEVSDANGIAEKMLQILSKTKSIRGSEYSIKNSFIIALTRPNAEFVFSKNRWVKEFNRKVKDDAKPILLYRPNPKPQANISEDDPKYQEALLKFLRYNNLPIKRDKNNLLIIPYGSKSKFMKYLIGIGLASDTGITFSLFEAFDIADTEIIDPSKGDPIYNIESLDVNKVKSNDEVTIEKLILATIKSMKEDNLKVNNLGNYNIKDLLNQTEGFSQYDKIFVRDMKHPSKKILAVLLHEYTHAYLHQAHFKDQFAKNKTFEKEAGMYLGHEGMAADKNTREQQAEISCWVLLQYFGYEHDEGIVYVSSYKMTPELVKPIIDSVKDVVQTIYHKIRNNYFEVENEYQELQQQKQNNLSNTQTMSNPTNESKNYMTESNIFSKPLPTALEIAKMLGLEEEYKEGEEMMAQSADKFKEDFYESYHRFFGKHIQF